MSSNGGFQVWQCINCDEKRVWGEGQPEPQAAVGELVLLRCGREGKVRPHRFVAVQPAWAGTPSTLCSSGWRIFVVTRKDLGLGPLETVWTAGEE